MYFAMCVGIEKPSSRPKLFVLPFCLLLLLLWQCQTGFLALASHCCLPEAMRPQMLPDCSDGYMPPEPDFASTLMAKPDPYETSDPTTQALVLFRSDIFGQNNQDILYYSFLITEKNYCQEAEQGFWNITETWPNIPNWRNQTVPYQVTPIKWNPFKDHPNETKQITYILGDGSYRDEHYWNKPLEENTHYAFKIRGFTECGYRDTDVMFFQTLANLPVLRITSILAFVWMTTSLMICFSIFNFEWIKGLVVAPGRKSKDSFSPVPENLSQKGFLKYAGDLLGNPGRLGNEFHLLGTLSSDVSTLCLHALRVDNKQKNRYGNILPFDMTRVKLSIRDDDPSTDYINASFIKGYTDEIEYIASQGPQKETCHDFYRMIMEQNIEIIVMLTDLFENEKEKCMKYYPNEGEVMLVNDIGIFCSQVEEFQFYRKRILTVTRGEKDRVVTQFQYKQWGDFVCPNSTNDMMIFCDLIRKTPHKGCILVHCSAGAGRTGTFIAIDILLQRVKHGNKINVFNTILKLRQQRVGMVQTEAQMAYIYKCISQAIEASAGKNKETV